MFVHYEEKVSSNPYPNRTRTPQEPDRCRHGPRPQAHPRSHPAHKADQSPEGPAWVDEEVAQAVEVSQPTVSRVRKHYFEEGLEAALNRRAPNREYHRKLDGKQEARLIALACSEPPEGQARWSLRLLAERMVELEVVDDLSYQTVRRTLKKTNLSLS
jgi:transposase